MRGASARQASSGGSVSSRVNPRRAKPVEARSAAAGASARRLRTSLWRFVATAFAGLSASAARSVAIASS
jgi:hypothetical protein